MATRDVYTAADEGFRRLLASPRFQRLAGGPPPRRAPSPERQVPRRIGAALMLVTFVPIGLVAGLLSALIVFLFVSTVADFRDGRDFGGAACALGVCGGVAASCGIACRAAWRSLWPTRRQPIVQSDPSVVRKAARVLRTERRGPRLAEVEVFGEVEVEYDDGVRVAHRARVALVDALHEGDMGVAHLVEANDRLVDFVVLFQRYEPGEPLG